MAEPGRMPSMHGHNQTFFVFPSAQMPDQLHAVIPDDFHGLTAAVIPQNSVRPDGADAGRFDRITQYGSAQREALKESAKPICS